MKNDSEESLPPGWKRVALADVVRPSKEKIEPSETKSGTPYLSLEHIESGSGEIIARGTSADVCSTKAVFRPGDVLYGKLRPYLNKVATPDFAGVCSTDIIVFPPAPAVLSSYLAFYLRTRKVVEYANHNSNGVQLPRISFDKLGELPFPLPPLAEQRRIVAKVEAVLARVNAARDRLAKVPALLKRFRQSTLAAACSGKLTADWREKNPQHAMLPDTLHNEQRRVWPDSDRTLKRLAKGTDDGAVDANPPTWARVCVAQCISEAPCNGISPPGRETPPGVAALKLNAMTGNGFDYTAIKYIQIEGEVAEDLRIIPSDFFVSRGNGSSALVGRGTLAQAPPQLVVFPDTMIRLRFIDMIRVTRWIPTIWESRAVRLQIEAKAKTSAGIWKISQPDLCSIIVPLPPLAEQYEIVRRVEALFALADKIETRVAAASARADKLIQSTLAKAFRGELVPNEHALNEAAVIHAQKIDEGLAVLYALALLYTWKASPDRRAFELGMILMQKDGLRQRILKGPSAMPPLNARRPSHSPSVGRIDEFIGELAGTNTISVTNRQTRQLIALGPNAPAKAGLLKASVGKKAFIMADEAVRAVAALDKLGQSLDQYSTADDYDTIEIAIS